MTKEEFLRVLDVVDAVEDGHPPRLGECKYWWRVACDRVKERLRTEFEGKLT